MTARMVDSISDVLPSSNTARMVWSFSIGKPTQAASPRGEKSTSPRQAAMTYDTMTPSNTGIILTMPLPQMDATMTVTIDRMASSQLV